MMQFELVSGKHVEAGVQYREKGDIIESSSDLCKLFGAKFRRVGAGGVATVEPVAVVPTKKRSTKKPTKKKKLKVRRRGSKTVDGRGVETTSQFDMDSKDGLKVFRRGNWYHVFEKDSIQPLNTKALKKTDVKSFVENYLEE